MHHLLRKQVILLAVIVCGALSAGAQKPVYRLNDEGLTYYFGLTLGYNTSYLHQTKSAKFLETDSVMSVDPGTSGGVAVGLLATFRMTEHFQFRVNPQLIIGGSKYLSYTLNKTKPGEAIFQRQVLPSTLVSFPIHLKFNSDRIGNFKTYLLGGVKYDIDLSSNSAIRNADDIVKLKSGDFGAEVGMGFNFYLPFVTVSPEIKFSYGITNIHQLDPALKLSNVLDKIQSRMIMFSIHFEH